MVFGVYLFRRANGWFSYIDVTELASDTGSDIGYLDA